MSATPYIVNCRQVTERCPARQKAIDSDTTVSFSVLSETERHKKIAIESTYAAYRYAPIARQAMQIIIDICKECICNDNQR